MRIGFAGIMNGRKSEGTRGGIVKRTLFTLIVMAALLLLPAQAFAIQPGYSVDQMSTDLYVETNASVHAIERQTVTFEGESRGLVWHLHTPGEYESVKISSLRVVELGDEGEAVGEWLSLQLIDSDPDTQGLRPGDGADAALRGDGVQPWYSYSISDGMVRCYFPASQGTYLVEADYTVTNLANMYRDVGELYWRYVQSDMPVDVHDATLRIALPVPAGAEVIPGATVRAWGHGPSDGMFSIGEDGSVVFHADLVLAGHYAEAHVLLPSYWLDNVSLGSPARHSEARRLDAVSDETDWLDQAARGSIWDNKVRMLFVPLISLAALVAIGVAVAFKRTVRTRRWFVRIAATLGIVALAEHAFFREPITTVLLLAAAAIIALLAIFLPREDEPANEGETEES